MSGTGLLRLGLRALLPLALLAATPAHAADGFATSPLGPYLLLDGEGIWQGTLNGDAYSLANETDANAATTLFVDPRGGETPYWDLSVEVQIGDVPGGMAGLLFGRQQEDPPFYLALVIDTKGAASVLQRNPGGLDRLAVFDKAQLVPGGFNTLRIVEGPGAFEVFVNGTRVGIAKTDVAGTGSVGILAAGKGRFTFRSFALRPVPGTMPVAATSAPDAGPEAPAEPAGAPEAASTLDAIGYSMDTALPTPAAADPPRTAPLVDLPLPPERPPEFD